MEVASLALPEVRLITPVVREDARGRFVETWQGARYAEAGLPTSWAQDNLSHSQGNVLRGLHGQHPVGQGKLITVVAGRIWDVAVDVRRGSPRFGRWVAVELDAARSQQVYIPPGFAHGFCTPWGPATVSYKVTAPWDQASEFSVRWNDPFIGIEWPVQSPTLSAKDADAPLLSQLPARYLAEHRESAPGAGADLPAGPLG